MAGKKMASTKTEAKMETKRIETKKIETAKMDVAKSSSDSKTLESKLARLLRGTEEEVEKIFTNLKARGLTKTQVVALVEAIHREENEIIFAEQVIRGDLKTNQEDLMDEADLASSDIEQGMKMRMANRENFKVKRLHKTLDKIREGSYGECEGCGADIGFARLSARVIAELCIACKEEEERKENLSAVGRRHKSTGQGLTGPKLNVN